MDRIATVGDMRLAARRRLPRLVFDYIDGGGGNEYTLRTNIEDFQKIKFHPRSLEYVSERKLSTTLVGQPTAMPAAIAPTGLSGLVWGPEGEIAAARAAKTAGIPFTAGMLSVRTLEEITGDVGPTWFQICMLSDRGIIRELLQRAIAAECPVLILTVVWGIGVGQSRMIRNGVSVSPTISLRHILGFATHPVWVARRLMGKRAGFGNFEGIVDDPSDLAGVVGNYRAVSTTYEDVEWVRSIWPGKLIVKGICGKEEARRVMDLGVDGVSVSNHGGVVVDNAASTISLLPEVVEGVDGRGDVLLDGGIRSGQDLLKVLAYGGKGGLLGRAHLYGLGAYGEKGVAKVLDIIRQEFDVTLAQVGLKDVDDISEDVLYRGAL